MVLPFEIKYLAFEVSMICKKIFKVEIVLVRK